MKIQAKNNNIKSMKLSVPVDGLIEIDSNGIAEVSEKCGNMLIEGTNDWKEYGTEETTTETETADEKAENDGEKDEKKSNDDEVIAGIEKLSLQDCIETAEAAGYPKKEWEKLSENKKAPEMLMRKYLIKKYKDTLNK